MSMLRDGVFLPLLPTFVRNWLTLREGRGKLNWCEVNVNGTDDQIDGGHSDHSVGGVQSDHCVLITETILTSTHSTLTRTVRSVVTDMLVSAYLRSITFPGDVLFSYNIANSPQHYSAHLILLVMSRCVFVSHVCPFEVNWSERVTVNVLPIYLTLAQTRQMRLARVFTSCDRAEVGTVLGYIMSFPSMSLRDASSAQTGW